MGIEGHQQSKLGACPLSSAVSCCSVQPLQVEELAKVLTVDFDGLGQEGIPRLNLDWR